MYVCMYVYIYIYIHTYTHVHSTHIHIHVHILLVSDSLRGSSVKLGTMQRRLAWPLRKVDTHKSRSVSINITTNTSRTTKITNLIIHN